MRTLLAVLLAVLALTDHSLAQGKPEVTEIDAWLVRDAQMSSQFAVADPLGYFKAEGIKVNPRWYIAGTDLPSMWGAGNIDLGTATATMVVPIAAAGQTIYNIAPQSDVAGTQQIVLGKKGQEIVRSPKDFEKVKIGMPKGASVTMAIQAMGREHGVDFNKIQFVNLSPPDAVTALAKGDIDAMAGLGAVGVQRRQAGGRQGLLHRQPELHPRQGRPGGLATRARRRGGQRQDAQGESQHAEGGAARAAQGDRRDQHRPRGGREDRRPRDEDGRGADPRHHGAQHLLDGDEREDPSRHGRFIDFLHSLDRIKQKFPPESVIYTKLLEEADPALVKWKSKTEVK